MPNVSVAAAGEKASAAYQLPSALPLYGPVRAATPKDLPADVLARIPAGFTFVYWDDQYKTMQGNLARLKTTEILWLPERTAPYLWDVTGGFLASYPGGGRYRALYRGLNAGIAYAGPGAIDDLGPGTHPSFAENSDGNQNKICEWYSRAFLINGTTHGRTLGMRTDPSTGKPVVQQFDHTKLIGDGAMVLRMQFVGANRGWKASPPGETGGVNMASSDGFEMWNSIIDGRDPATGAEVGSSNLMLNNARTITIGESLLRNSVNGMPTAYRCGDLKYYRVKSQEQDGAAFNFEQCFSTVDAQPGIYMEGCDSRGKRADKGDFAANGMSVEDGGVGSVLCRIVAPLFDGPEYVISRWGTYGYYPSTWPVVSLRGKPRPNAQRKEDITVLDAAGRPIPIKWI